jgi:hypothetical protein
MVGAPSISGTAGTLISAFDACFLNGFNTKTISSITVTDNVATATTTTNHEYMRGAVVVISGANEAVFNGDFRVTSVGNNTTSFTFDITTAETAASGTITCKVSPLGFEKPYSGTNLAVYRSPVGNRKYLRVDDTVATEATARAYETMSGVSTGTGETSQLFWRRSEAASTAVRSWWLIGTNKCFYFFPRFDNNTSLTFGCPFTFGEFLPMSDLDTWNTLIIGQASSSTTMQNSHSFDNIQR